MSERVRGRGALGLGVGRFYTVTHANKLVNWLVQKELVHSGTERKMVAATPSEKERWRHRVRLADEAARKAMELRTVAAAAAQRAVQRAAAADAADSAASDAWTHAADAADASKLAHDLAKSKGKLAEAAEQEARAAVRDADEAKKNISLRAETATANVDSGAGTWDVQISINCVRPTGKASCHVQYDTSQLLEETRQQIDAKRREIEQRAEEHAHARAAVQRARDLLATEQEAARMAEASQRDAHAALEALISQQAALASGEWRPPLEVVSSARAHDCWLQTLGFLQARMAALHERGAVVYGSFGFVRSDIEQWRRVWARGRSSGGGTRPVKCKAPGAPCACSFCLFRAHANLRSGAHRSHGDGGAFDVYDSLAATGAKSAHRRAGTRISGVARVHGSSAATATAFLTEQLVAALHEARDYARLDLLQAPDSGLMTTQAAVLPNNLDDLGIFDVMWSDNSAGSLVSTPRSSLASPRSCGLPSSPRDSGSASRRYSSTRPLSPRPSSPQPSCSPRSRTPPTRRAPPCSPRSTAGSDASAEGLAVGPDAALLGRPVRTNPHAVLLIDVHTRLLRTNGSSFAYLSGRAQSAGLDDEGLPWFGVGRHDDDFQADLQLVSNTLRRVSSRARGSASAGCLTSPSPRIRASQAAAAGLCA